MKLTRTHILLAGLFITLNSAHSQTGKLYKWVDKNGVVSYQDQPPPKNAKVLSEEDIKPSAKTGGTTSSRLPKVVIYTVEDCDVCVDLINVLNRAEIAHAELPLLGDADVQSKITLEAGSLSAPTIYIGDKVLQTNSITELRTELKGAGFKIDDQGKKASQ